MKEIKLSQFGKNRGLFVTSVDDEDYEYLNCFKWHAHKSRYNIYADTTIMRRDGSQTTIKMPSLIMKIPKGMVLDHIDRNTLNNQKSNLRLCTLSQNNMNRVRKLNDKYTSKYRGVFFHKHCQKYTGHVGLNHKRYYIGYYKNELDAAHAYDTLAKKLHGEFASINIRDNKPVSLFGGKHIKQYSLVKK